MAGMDKVVFEGWVRDQEDRECGWSGLVLSEAGGENTARDIASLCCCPTLTMPWLPCCRWA